LDRIKIDQLKEPSLAFLEKLQWQHLITVPFENLDIIQGKTISLDESLIYEKVIIRRRGGFCYELNGLFAWLLREIGFSVTTASGRVYLPREDKFTPDFDHMVLLVHLDKTYLVDVGFGDSFRQPIEMPDGEEEDIGGRYRLRAVPMQQDHYILEKEEKDEWSPQYRFTTYPREMPDFAEMCQFHQTSPESPFTQGPFCTIATEAGRLTLSERSLTITEGQEKRKICVSSPEEGTDILRKHFGMEV
jgi:N-hydroxyarylamine O-acetyltransferase